MPPILCPSRIERVVVHARGALVTRTVTLPESIPRDPCELVVDGITPLAEPASFRALASGKRDVVSVAARFVIPTGPAGKGAAKERVMALEAEREELVDSRSCAVGRRNLLAGLSFDLGLNKRFQRANPRDRIDDALAMSRLVTEELAALDATINEIDVAIERCSRAIEAAQLAEAQARTEEREGTSRPTLACHLKIGVGASELSALSLEYVVHAARWWPTYKAWLTKGGARVRLELDALVAQDTGEDWNDVALVLSTADLVHDARLPELPSLRLGRSQPPRKRGYRPPPEGLDAMFEAYDAAMKSLSLSKPKKETEASVLFSLRELAAASPSAPSDQPAAPRPRGAGPPLPARAAVLPDGGGGPPGAPPPPPPSMAMPMPMQPMRLEVSASLPQQSVERSKKISLTDRLGKTSAGSARSSLGGMGDELMEMAANMPIEPAAPPPPLEPDDAWLDFDSLMLPARGERRGRLFREAESAARREASSAKERMNGMSNPARTRDPLGSRGRFDHSYEAEGKGDVPSNARPHRVHVTAKEGPATARFRTVPRESAEVYREARIENPFATPLLAGPVDVFLEGALLTTTDVGAVDRGGHVLVGLGVEERLRIARNARVDESSAGLLGGSTVVDHQVTVDLSSSLGLSVTVEVLERIPVTDDKDVSIKVTSAEPEPETYDQSDAGSPVRGGRRFKVEVPAGGKAKVVYGYRIKLPAKSEIVGGNRRE